MEIITNTRDRHERNKERRAKAEHDYLTNKKVARHKSVPQNPIFRKRGSSFEPKNRVDEIRSSFRAPTDE